MTNFDPFLSDPQFAAFAPVAVAAEKIYAIDSAACALNCRRAMEFAVKWMYSVDSGLVTPYDDRLVSLMDIEDLRAIVGPRPGRPVGGKQGPAQRAERPAKGPTAKLHPQTAGPERVRYPHRRRGLS